VEALRDAGAMPWLGRRAAYTLGAPAFSLAGAAATVVAPLLLAPERFGDYILLLAVFQYACALDLGLSQLADRIAGARGGAQGMPAVSTGDLVWSRLAVGVCGLLLAVPVSFALVQPGGALTFGNLFLAAAGGVAFMLSNGPVALYRAGSRIWEFTFGALVMQAGLSLPRLAGLVLGGVTGCFAALAAWYALTAVLLNQPFGATLRSRPAPGAVVRTLGVAVPLFAFNALWLLYLTANRWIASALSEPLEFGLFAFGANLAAVGVGVLSTVAQAYYPRHLRAAGDADSPGAALWREMLGLLGAVAIATAAGVAICRYAVPVVFPRYAEAADAAAALVASGVPLGVAAWLLPLAVATARRPWAEAAAVFLAAFLALGGAMAVGDAAAGIVGQAWGCALAALVPLAALLALLARRGMLRPRAAWAILALSALAVALDGLVWSMLFGLPPLI
jgi:hypothetical protein